MPRPPNVCTLLETKIFQNYGLLGRDVPPPQIIDSIGSHNPSPKPPIPIVSNVLSTCFTSTLKMEAAGPQNH
jgi:hypothetical protein